MADFNVGPMWVNTKKKFSFHSSRSLLIYSFCLARKLVAEKCFCVKVSLLIYSLISCDNSENECGESWVAKN